MKYLYLILLAFSLNSQASEIVPIKNKYPELKNSISKQEVIWLYTMRTRFWEDGTKVTVLYMDIESSTHKRFVSTVLNIDTDRFNRIVAANVNSGNASSFRKVGSVTELLNKVTTIPGSIGYIDEHLMAFNGGDDVKILRITK